MVGIRSVELSGELSKLRLHPLLVGGLRDLSARVLILGKIVSESMPISLKIWDLTGG